VSKTAITERNRANASQSTGPKTASGKAVVSRNAVQHGATAKPDPENVAIWLRIILNEPDAMPIDAFEESEVFLAAYRLAETEVQLIAAKQALRDFATGEAAPSKASVGFEEQVLDYFDLLKTSQMTGAQRRTREALVDRIRSFQLRKMRGGERQHHLLKRYLGEARSQRRKAFTTWIAILNAEHLDKRVDQAA
jgi:hypothetical protein